MNSSKKDIELLSKWAKAYYGLSKLALDDKNLNADSFSGWVGELLGETKKETPSGEKKEKPKKNYRDRFNGLEGEAREKAILEAATKKGYRIVPKQKTGLNEQDVLRGLNQIVIQKHPGISPEEKKNLLVALTSQIKAETGFAGCFNYNVGNYHAVGSKNTYWDGSVFIMDDPQRDLKTGERYINKDWFWRSYSSLAQGLGDWYSFLFSKHKGAIDQAIAGNIQGYSQALGEKRYYTENIKTYTGIVSGVATEIAKHYDKYNL